VEEGRQVYCLALLLPRKTSGTHGILFRANIIVQNKSPTLLASLFSTVQNLLSWGVLPVDLCVKLIAYYFYVYLNLRK
jgi:hypothetical protein